MQSELHASSSVQSSCSLGLPRLGHRLSDCIRLAFMEPSVCEELDMYFLAAVAVR
jgi:hypothetical protein